MNEFREKLIDRMIKQFGFEHPNTIAFANLCEATWISDEALEKAVEQHEASGIFEDWEISPLFYSRRRLLVN